MDETNESVYEACKAFGLRANGDLFARMNGNYLKWKRGEEREREREREREEREMFYANSCVPEIFLNDCRIIDR
jgi:hypothetical protein